MTKITITFLVLLGLLFSTSCKKDDEPVKKQTDTLWTKLKDLPAPMTINAGYAINGKLYCLRTDWTAFTVARTIFEYDPVSDKWTEKASMPDKRWAYVTACINNKIYVIGGSTKLFTAYSKSVNEYDPATDTWTLKKEMPTARGDGLSSIVYENKIYVIGGGVENGHVLGNVEAYDPASDTWYVKKSLNVPRAFVMPVVVNNKIYAVGGFAQNEGDGMASGNNEEYDPATNTWTIKPRLSIGGAYIVSLNDKIYFFDEPKNGSNNFVEYDPVTNTSVKKSSTLSPHYEYNPLVLNNQIYIVGGALTSQKNTFSRKVEMFDPKVGSWKELKSLTLPQEPFIIPMDKKIFAIGNTVEVYDTNNN